eukprot:TRINITY_DN7645_c0_g1_i1.p1 TRINITY_DN7645_c0_g1~~TRINITY_DN7645_c0_g1_i1.p1  ORF type:complete len:257 (-),score=30.93 TRINITY_DN7645_c0_g1_i1:229-999(-)
MQSKHLLLQQQLCQVRGTSRSISRVGLKRKGKYIQAVAVELQHTSKTIDKKEESEGKLEESFKDKQLANGKTLSAHQMRELLTLICEGTEFAQVDLQIGDFELKLKRSKAVTPVEQAVVPIPEQSPFSSTQEIGSLMSSVEDSIMSSVDFTESQDEILAATVLPITAPKVGVLRRGRYAKGKRIGKADLVSEGDEVRKGQVVCYVEQLGTHVPVEAPQAGEVIMILEDGTPVEYLQSVAEISPFFGGHIIGDSKYA